MSFPTKSYGLLKIVIFHYFKIWPNEVIRKWTVLRHFITKIFKFSKCFKTIKNVPKVLLGPPKWLHTCFGYFCSRTKFFHFSSPKLPIIMCQTKPTKIVKKSFLPNFSKMMALGLFRLKSPIKKFIEVTGSFLSLSERFGIFWKFSSIIGPLKAILRFLLIFKGWYITSHKSRFWRVHNSE